MFPDLISLAGVLAIIAIAVGICVTADAIFPRKKGMGFPLDDPFDPKRRI